MIRIWFFIALFLIPASIAAGENRKSVVVSASMMADMAENIAGTLVDVQYIVPRGQDPHLYKPTPSDVIMVEKADLILVNGLTFEGWITKLIENSGTKAPTITITNGIRPIQSSQYANSYDPHAWMDVSLAITYVDNILSAFIELLPEHEQQFRENHRKYVNQLRELDAYIMEAIRKIPPEKRILITSHDAFEYYGKRYGLKLEAVMGISTEADVQSSDIIRVHKAIREFNVPAIFVESTINPKILQQIARDNNIIIGGQLYADSLGDKNSPAATYLEMLKHNTDTIVKGLSGQMDPSPEGLQGKNSTLKNWWLYGLLAGIFAVSLIVLFIKLNKNQ